MTITINNQTVTLAPETITITTLLDMRGINPQGTAVAVNGKVCRRQNWDSTHIADGDNITVISASFGG